MNAEKAPLVKCSHCHQFYDYRKSHLHQCEGKIKQMDAEWLRMAQNIPVECR